MAQIYLGYYLLSIKGGTVALPIPALVLIWTKFSISMARVFCDNGVHGDQKWKQIVLTKIY